MKRWAHLLAATSSALLGCGGSGGDGRDACVGAEPCGGDVLGRWVVDSTCAPADDVGVGFESALPTECSGSFRGGSLQAEGVTVEFTADQVSFEGALYTEIDYFLDQTCLTAIAAMFAPSDSACGVLAESTQTQLRMQDPASEASCTFSDGGCACTTAVTVPYATSSSYSIQGNQLVSGAAMVDYCVSGEQLQFDDPSLGPTLAHRE